MGRPAPLILSLQENYGAKFSVAVGKTSAGGQGWTHEFTFEALNSPSPNAVPVFNQ